MGKPGSLLLAIVVGVGVGPACSERPSPARSGNVAFVDGTRLKAVHYEIDGAPPYFLGWHDSTLGVACEFVMWQLPDHFVCFPSEPWQPQFAYGTSLFADSGCSEPLAGTDSPGESRYILQRWSQTAISCETTFRLFHVGDQVPSDPTSLYTVDETGACRAATAPEASYYQALHRLGPEIPIDTLVQGTFRHDAGASRIGPLSIVGSDGSVQGTIGTSDGLMAWDHERQEMVSMSTSLAPESRRWYPAFSHEASFVFADPTCTARAAVGNDCLGIAREASARSYEVDACGRPTPSAYFDLGPPLGDQASIYYPADGNSCVRNDEWPVDDPSYVAFSVGEPIPPTGFAQAVEMRTGTAQVQVVQVASPGGSAMGAVGLYDSVQGRPCAASVAGDGDMRCLPDTVDVSLPSFFSDAACSVPLVLGPLADVPCRPRPNFASTTEPGDQTGPSRRHLYPIAGPYTGTIYWAAGARCDAVGDNTNGGWGELLSVGPEIPPALFAPVNIVRPN
jgi:hypothetical protein